MFKLAGVMLSMVSGLNRQIKYMFCKTIILTVFSLVQEIYVNTAKPASLFVAAQVVIQQGLWLCNRLVNKTRDQRSCIFCLCVAGL
jgi:hypothetical protein